MMKLTSSGDDIIQRLCRYVFFNVVWLASECSYVKNEGDVSQSSRPANDRLTGNSSTSLITTDHNPTI